MRRKTKRSRYFLAFFVTVVIFLLGFLLGLTISSGKIEYIENLYKSQSADYESLQFQYVFLDMLENESNPNETCSAISAILENNLKLLGPAQDKIEGYEISGDINNEDYRIIKRKYMIANLRYWLLAERSKEVCGSDMVSIIYFYDQNCESCRDQGFILSQLKSIFEDNLLIFPMDASITEEPTIDILRRKYKIYEFPTLVIEEKTFKGFLSKSDILKEICPLYKKDYPVCEGFK